jgi:hypothetical protein
MAQQKESERDQLDQREIALRIGLTEAEDRLHESEQHISEITQINVDLDEENTRLISAIDESRRMYADLNRKFEDERSVLSGEIERLQNERAEKEQSQGRTCEGTRR